MRPLDWDDLVLAQHGTMATCRDMSRPVATARETTRPVALSQLRVSIDRSHTFADVEHAMIGGELLATDHVWYLGSCVGASDVDFLGNLDRVVDLNAEVANGAFDLRMSEQKLYRSEVPGAPVDQNRLRAPQ